MARRASADGSACGSLLSARIAYGPDFRVVAVSAQGRALGFLLAFGSLLARVLPVLTQTPVVADSRLSLSRRLGRRRSWIVPSQLASAALFLSL
eukprot:CAMPEP_0198360486 /NCGR_PEP_ID=MMETSP1450-20131203/138599_1 /TAXON_ID=753684 ORGANISM="Madagascaria erythrocladiodes, Strain CCMP3234" /NCGR_SAMPLE_ID=MMETSP1450 /ASSEMBLY_ACC=CAM_ASM_001115 /LENGTH=93 /DNA_ID=CAMNT_0044067503 /DNA_START=20 /DNA_END=299 /DNA_ORIENTATION=+